MEGKKTFNIPSTTLLPSRSPTARSRNSQLLQTISILFMNMELSSCRPTAPGIASKNAGHPQPESLSVEITDRYAVFSQSEGRWWMFNKKKEQRDVQFGGGFVQWCIARYAVCVTKSHGQRLCTDQNQHGHNTAKTPSEKRPNSR
jgi:hypothetical protein